MNFKKLFLAAGLSAATLFGCSSNEPAPTTEPAPGNDATAAALPIHKNDKGEILCPVMGTPIASVDKAVGHQDFEGTRYYFCCDGCPDQFKADPAKYAHSAEGHDSM